MPDTDNVLLNPAILDQIQNTFINKLNASFAQVGATSMNLFYLLAAIELTLFGVIWALKQESMMGDLLLKIMKVSAIFFVISQFPMLLQVIIDGFTQVGFTNNATAISIIFNPANIWANGFDSAISLLKLSVEYGTGNVGMSLIYILLGFGLLLLYGLIGAQIILAVASFYIVSLLSLLFIPFGVFYPARDFFSKAIQNVFRSGVRVIVLIFIIGVFVTLFSNIEIKEITSSTTLEGPLGLFFSALVFFVLAAKLPSMAADTVGKMSGGLSAEGPSSPSVSVTTTGAGPQGLSSAQQVAAGATIQGPVGSVATGGSGAMSQATSIAGGGGVTSVNVASNVQSAQGASVAPAGLMDRLGKGKKVDQATQVKGVSSETMNKMKSKFPR